MREASSLVILLDIASWLIGCVGLVCFGFCSLGFELIDGCGRETEDGRGRESPEMRREGAGQGQRMRHLRPQRTRSGGSSGRVEPRLTSIGDGKASWVDGGEGGKTPPPRRPLALLDTVSRFSLRDDVQQSLRATSRGEPRGSLCEVAGGGV